MKVITPIERQEMNAKALELAKVIHEKAEEARAGMTPEQLAKAQGFPHQSEREKARRLRQLHKSPSKT